MRFPTTLRLVVKEPGQLPQIRFFHAKSDKEAMATLERLIGGDIQEVNLVRAVAILCRQGSIAQPQPDNCGFVGTIVLIGLSQGAGADSDWCSLTERQAWRAVSWCKLHATDRYVGGNGDTGNEQRRRKEAVERQKQLQAEWDNL